MAKMTKRDRNRLLAQIENDGAEYALVFYSNWQSVKDEKFHELRDAFLKARADLLFYVSQPVK